MNQFRLAICDDEEVHIDNICNYLAAYESESGNRLLIERFDSAEILLKEFKNGKKQFDVLFLDVDMPDMSGTDAAVRIREFDTELVICFITSYENYAYEAFQVEATGYLVKPVKYTDFKHIMNKCITQIQYLSDREQAEELFFQIKTERSQTIVPVQSIMYIEKRRNKCVFHLADREVTSYDTLSNVYSHLNHSQFYFVHQGYIVNFDYIKEVLPDKICLASDLEVPVSRKYYKYIYDLRMDKLNRLRAERRAALNNN